MSDTARMAISSKKDTGPITKEALHKAIDDMFSGDCQAVTILMSFILPPIDGEPRSAMTLVKLFTRTSVSDLLTHTEALTTELQARAKNDLQLE